MLKRLGVSCPARVSTAFLALALAATACGDGGDEQLPAAGETAETADAAASPAPVDSGDATDGTPAAAGEEPTEVEDQDLLVAPVDTTPPDDGGAAAETLAELEPQYGGTLRVASSAEGDGLNPAANSFSVPVYLTAYPLFDPLAYFDTEGNWVPVLAESFTKVGDGTAWQMKLREGIRFHDGTELDADDMVATFNAQLSDPKLSVAYRPGFDPDEPIRKVDDYTVEFKGVRPAARLPIFFTTQLGMVLPSEYLERARADPTLNQFPVGTGPFKIERRVPDEKTVLVRNPDYWAADTVDIYLDRIEIEPITDSTTAVKRLISGELDLMVTSETEATLTLREAADQGVRTFENERAEETLALINTSSVAFADVRARQALTFATDRDAYVELVRQGVSPPADTMFHPDLVWHNHDVEQETNMPERAGPLVDAYCADLPANCTDGKIDMRVQMPGPSREADRTIDLLVDTWGEFFNVKATTKFYDRVVADVVIGNYDVALIQQFGEVDPDIEAIWMECGSIGFISLNFARYCDPERDELLYEQRRIDDLGRRVEIWRQIQEINRDAYTFIFLSHSNWVIGARDNVNNICGQIGPSGDELFCINQGRVWLNQLWLS